MATRFSVDLDRMEFVTERMARFDTALDVHLENLDARIRRLHVTWSGDAAQAQHDAHEEWLRAAGQMRAALATMRSITETAHGNYQAAIQANLSMWDDVAL
jgi:WXG100 family type VII secretion target